jgi:hypothetical protein
MRKNVWDINGLIKPLEKISIILIPILVLNNKNNLKKIVKIKNHNVYQIIHIISQI